MLYGRFPLVFDSSFGEPADTNEAEGLNEIPDIAQFRIFDAIDNDFQIIRSQTLRHHDEQRDQKQLDAGIKGSQVEDSGSGSICRLQSGLPCGIQNRIIH